MYINLANIDFGGEGGKKAVLQETTIESLLTETTKVVTPPEGVDGFNKVTVTHAPVETLTEATITSNGETTITPSAGFDATFGVKVNVDIPTGGKCLIGGPEWFDQIEKYSVLIYNGDVYAYVNKYPSLGYGEGIVPKFDAGGNQITDSTGNIVYEKFVPICIADYDSLYNNDPNQLYTIEEETSLTPSTFKYIRSHNTIRTFDFYNNEYYVEPIFFPIAICVYSDYSIWGVEEGSGDEYSCVMIWDFIGLGTHENPITFSNVNIPRGISQFQESLCNTSKTEFGGWVKCDENFYSNAIDSDYNILTNTYATEVNIIISNKYGSNLYTPGLPRFIKTIKAVEIEDGNSNIRLDGFFYGLNHLTAIPICDFKNITSADNILDECTALTTLGGFTGLKVNLNLSYSPLLTHDSLLNVINEAADVTASPKTLTLGATNLAKLTDQEKAIATSKGWTLK